MEVERTIIIHAQAEKVWEKLGPGYAQVGDWASGVFRSSARPEPPSLPNAPVEGRICETSIGPFTETITDYDPAAMRLAYSAKGDKMPFFVRSLGNRWTIERLGANRTRVTSRISADLMPPFSVLMGWMMKRQFGTVLEDTLEELRTFVETGNVHQRKRTAVLPARLAAA